MVTKGSSLGVLEGKLVSLLGGGGGGGSFPQPWVVYSLFLTSIGGKIERDLALTLCCKKSWSMDCTLY